MAEEAPIDSKCIVVSGNLCDGFGFHGPFEDFDEAAEYAVKELRHCETWIAGLFPPAADWRPPSYPSTVEELERED